MNNHPKSPLVKARNTVLALTIFLGPSIGTGSAQVYVSRDATFHPWNNSAQPYHELRTAEQVWASFAPYVPPNLPYGPTFWIGAGVYQDTGIFFRN
jgi:hypothetical protein